VLKKKTAWLSLLLVFGLVAAACGDDGDDTSSDTTEAAGGEPADAGDYSGLSGSITGSGSSFTDAFLQEAIVAFADVSDLEVTYNAVGSGTGKEEFGGDLTDFAGTDSLVKDGDGPEAGSFLYVPTVAAPITVSYNLSDVPDLQLSADTLAGIMQGDITSWDDEAIAADNPDADLPSEDVIIVHRADGSGTTSNFTKYLDKASDVWTLGAGDEVEWPTSSQAGEKNTGVAQLIKDNEGAIGYVDLSDAEASGLTFAAIKNKDGEYVLPTLEGVSSGLEGAEVADDLTYDPLDAAGADAYPITSPTYLLVRTTYADQQTADNVKGFLTFVLTDAQDLAEDVAYAKLPDSLREKALAQLDQITVG
jgi:phosphate transport system substrate-binding protein